MKTRNALSALLLAVGILTTSVVFGQSCDTLRNYSPSDPLYQFSIDPTNLVLGNMTGADQVDTYNMDEWAEKYTVSSATEVRAVRLAPWKVQNTSGSATLTIQVYNDAGTEPGAVIGSQIVNYDDLDEGYWNTVEFTTPVNVSGSFYVGYKLSYTNYPQDLFGLLGTQPSVNFTKVYASTVGGGSGSFEGWDDVSGWVALGGNPANIAFAFDVLTSTGTIPVPNFTGDNAVACLSGSFTGLDASSTTGDVDVYEWWLTDDPATQIYTDDFGVNGTLNPTTSNPSNQRIYLWTDGACVTRGVYSPVTVNPDVTATVSITNATCGDANGELTITASGGDGTYLYSIDGGATTQPSGSFIGLASGTYNIEVTSPGNGCTFTQVVNINNTPPEAITVGSNQTICAGDNATITASGNGSIEWFDGSTSIGTGTSINVSPTTTTTYNAVLTDGNGCTDAQTVDVVVNPVDDAGFVYSNTSICMGSANETPTINTPGGTFTVAQSGLSINSSTGEINVSSSFAGTYDVTYTTNGTCSDAQTQSITIDPLDDAGFSYSTNTICLGGSNETPTVNTSGGTFTVAQSGLTINSATGEINMSSSSAGIYDVTYTTNGTCPATETQTITITSSPDASFVYPNTTYCQNDGTISPDFSGGGSAGTFSSTQGLSITGSGNIDLTSSSDGVYTVTNTIAASGACPQVIETFDITVLASPVVNAGQDQDVCEGTNVTLTGAGDANTYSWDNSVTDGVAFTPSVGAVTYTVVGTAANGCESTDQVTVTVSATPTVDAGLDQTICAGESVTLTATASAGTVTWDNNVNDGVAFVPTQTTTYTVTTDDNGCTATDDVVVTVNASPVVNAGQDQNICEGTDVTITATGDADSYSWDNGITQGTPFTPTVGTTTYEVTGTATNGCESTDQVTVTVSANPTVNAGPDQVICQGESVTLTATATNGTISWDNNVNNGVAFAPNTTATYTVTADDNGCTATDDVVVTVNPLPNVDAGQDQTTCVYYDAIGLTGTPQGGVFTGPGMTGYDFDPAAAGEGTHTITYTYTDGNGCENSATIDITVDECLGLAENDLNTVTIAPNPASEYIQVGVGENNSIESVQILSLEGQNIAVGINSVNSHTVKLNVSSVAKGTYFIRLSTEKGQIVKKIVVN